jgi:undecaprenyl-diphosphatase UppP
MLADAGWTKTMDIILLLKAAILGIVEGLTEFLPISSTGHLILVGDLLNFNDERGKVFEIVIQFAAILAVCWEFRAKIFTVVKGLPREAGAQKFVLNLFIAFLPAAVLGLLFAKAIKEHLFAPVPVALAFIIGGFIILWAEKREHKISVQTADDLTWKDALKVGCAQALAMIPGTSRSGATIIGGLLFGLNSLSSSPYPRCSPRQCMKSSSIAAYFTPTTGRCSRSGASPPSSVLFFVCAGCCATSAATISPCSPGIASPSAWWYLPPITVAR